MNCCSRSWRRRLLPTVEFTSAAARVAAFSLRLTMMRPASANAGCACDARPLASSRRNSLCGQISGTASSWYFFVRVPRRVSARPPQCGHASGAFDVCGARAMRGVGISGECAHRTMMLSREHVHETRAHGGAWSTSFGSRLSAAASPRQGCAASRPRFRGNDRRRACAPLTGRL